MSDIDIPRVAVSRDLASDLVKESFKKSGAAESIVVNGRKLVVNSDGFASQLAKDLKFNGANVVHLVGGSPSWVKSFTEAATEFQLKVVA